MKKLTVIVSLYNSGEWIDNRLNNLFNSSVINDIDIWCINSDSPDIRDHNIPLSYNNIKYIKLPARVNVYSAWNYVISNSSSQYITNANSDDIVAPNCYEELIKILDKQNDFAYPSWYTTTTPNLKWSDVQQHSSSDGLPGKYAGDIGKAGVGHFPMWKRSLHQKFGLFDESFHALGDAEWWARCFYVGRSRFKWLNKRLACYLWRNGDNLWNRMINSSEWELYHKKVVLYQLGK